MRVLGAGGLLLAVAAAACGGGSAAPAAGRTGAPTSGSASPSSAAEPSTAAGGTSSAPSAAPPPADRHPTGAAITLAFGGDVHFEGSVRARLDADPQGVLESVAGALRGADLAMVNLETAITRRGAREPKQFTFRAPPVALRGIKAAGIDVVTVANNHGQDYGPVGLEDTLAAGRAAGLPIVGAGTDEAAAFEPYRVTVKGQRVAVIGATQVLDAFAIERWAAGPGKAGLASAKHEDVLIDAVRRARADSDTVVVYLHWGRERTACPIPPQREVAARLVEAGADVVVGSHAHVLLGSGYLNGAYVDYGLGNFLFYASGGGPNTRSGVLTLTVRGRAVTSDRWTPAVLSGGRTSLLAGTAADRAVRAHDAQRGCTGLAATP